MPPSPPNLSITAIVAVKNEERNIARCLRSLAPARQVVVADSGSTDATAAIAREHGARVVQFTYGGRYPKKRQWVLDSHPIDTEWILLIDADEVVPEALWEEMASAIASARADAFLVRKQFHFLGRKFRFGGFSHRAVILFRRGAARFESLFDDDRSGLDMEVHERMIVAGRMSSCRTALIHEDLKGLDAYVERHRRYAEWEAALREGYLRGGTYGRDAITPRLLGNIQERRRFLKLLVMRIPAEPWVWFLYHYVVRLGVLEGRRGLIACRLRADYIRAVRSKLRERMLAPAG